MKLSDPYNVAEFRSRATAVAFLFTALFLVLLGRLWYLQIWQGEVYRGFSDRNRFKFVRLSAPRGQIFDRNGQLLADSRPRFDITFTRGNSQDVEGELKVLQKIFDWSDDEYKKKLVKAQEGSPYQPVPLMQDIDRDELSLIETQNLDLPSVDVDVESVRDYLYEDLFFHSIGYTGEINETELKNLQSRYPERNYRLGDQKGIIGVESIFEGQLRGKDGRDFLVVDVKGRRVNQEEWDLLPQTTRITPIAGDSLQLSLDLELQEAATKAFGDKVGALVALDPKTGQVLAYVSRPALDPNIFTRPISTEDFSKMMNMEHNPFLDRVVGEHYPPGSTFKLVMATAALETGAIDLKTHFFCPGYFRMGNRVWKCWRHEGHGNVNVIEAIEGSCDVFFYNVALALGLDSMFAWSSRLGLGRPTYIGNEILQGHKDRLVRFNSEVPGFIPNIAWVEQRRQTSVEGETINAGIGQGAYTVTALQLARVISAIGNGGKIFQPQIVLGYRPSGETQMHLLKPILENELHIRPEVREAVMKGMQLVVEGPFGTAHGAHIPGMLVGGKTGTAQVVSLELAKTASKENKKKFQDHGLFVALAPLNDPKIAIAIVVENGGHGSGVAPIAKALIQNYLLRGVAQTDPKKIKVKTKPTENPEPKKDDDETAAD